MTRRWTSVAWLRQLMDWQKRCSTPRSSSTPSRSMSSGRVFVFTPKGDVLALRRRDRSGFAYRSYRGGHRCIVPSKRPHGGRSTTAPERHILEVLTSKDRMASRDCWLCQDRGRLAENRSVQEERAKKTSAKQGAARQGIPAHAAARAGLDRDERILSSHGVRFTDLNDFYARHRIWRRQPALGVAQIHGGRPADGRQGEFRSYRCPAVQAYW